MRTGFRKLPLVAGILLFVLVVVVLLVTAPKNPVAVIRVVDAAGKPVQGAVVRPEGLRTKPGPYVSGWYGWVAIPNGAPNTPVESDAKGYVRLPYPQFVFERIETGTLCLSVSHPDYVADRPERVVATAPPAGAPWRERIGDLWNRVRHVTFEAHPDPIVLQRGAVVEVSLTPDDSIPATARMFAQVSGETHGTNDFWTHPGPRSACARQLASGPHSCRAFVLDVDGSAWFSPVTNFVAVSDQTNRVVLPLKRGVAIHGRLDAAVPRPVRNGRVSARVTPQGAKLQDDPPIWQVWAPVNEDGTFATGLVPEGLLEITALCDGFISTNGPGQFKMRYPQQHLVGGNDLEISIGMEPTARLEVMVADDQGRPLKDARVVTWPNVRYGEWSALIFMSDCSNSSDYYLRKNVPDRNPDSRNSDFEGVSDEKGLAVLPNLPPDEKSLMVIHPEFTLAPVDLGNGQKSRQASFVLTAGQTNRISLRLERSDKSAISHY